MHLERDSSDRTKSARLFTLASSSTSNLAPRGEKLKPGGDIPILLCSVPPRFA
jgi:hypothetical protein